jgi:hypothetical protein
MTARPASLPGGAWRQIVTGIVQPATVSGHQTSNKKDCSSSDHGLTLLVVSNLPGDC